MKAAFVLLALVVFASVSEARFSPLKPVELVETVPAECKQMIRTYATPLAVQIKAFKVRMKRIEAAEMKKYGEVSSSGVVRDAARWMEILDDRLARIQRQVEFNDSYGVYAVKRLCYSRLDLEKALYSM